MMPKAAGKPLVRPGDKKLVKRKPLSFIENAPDPLDPDKLQDRETAEAEIKDEVKAVKVGIVERLKADQKRKEASVGADYYFSVVFEDGGQAMAFLKAIGYPYPADSFIDGLILSDLMKVEIPKATMLPKEIDDKHDKELTGLVTRPEWRKPKG